MQHHYHRHHCIQKLYTHIVKYGDHYYYYYEPKIKPNQIKIIVEMSEFSFDILSSFVKLFT